MLETIVGNGLKASWSALGHEDGMGQILPLLKANEELRRSNEPPPTEITFAGQVESSDSEANFVEHEDA